MRLQHFAPSLLVLCSFSVSAIAEPTEYATVVAEPDVSFRVVSYGDLNLQRHEGVATLYRRIQIAANIVCTQVNSAAPQVVLRARSCASDATSRAVAKVGVPALSTLHVARTQKGQAQQMVVARGTR